MRELTKITAATMKMIPPHSPSKPSERLMALVMPTSQIRVKAMAIQG